MLINALNDALRRLQAARVALKPPTLAVYSQLRYYHVMDTPANPSPPSEPKNPPLRPRPQPFKQPDTTAAEQPESQSQPETKRRPANSVFRYLQVTLIVAALLATLFTAWTPSGLMPGGLEQFQIVTPVVNSPITGVPTATERPKPRIGIIAGHWSKDAEGYDPGAVCPDALGATKEVDVNYNVAIRVQQQLNTQGYEVDIFQEWDNRLSIYQAMALIAIHTDSCEFINAEATGFKIAPTSANTISTRLAACLQDRYAQATQLTIHPGITPDMTSYHAFNEIHNETPAAIIELGFLNRDHEILTQRPDVLAAGIINGILCFVRNEPIATATPSPTP